MKVGVSRITLHLPGCHSLKDKRQVIKSVTARIRQKFEVAIAEVLAHVQHFIEETRPDVIVTNTEVEIINW
jgi:uncharacterized protein